MEKKKRNFFSFLYKLLFWITEVHCDLFCRGEREKERLERYRERKTERKIDR